MFGTLKTMAEEFKQMPHLLKLITVHAMACFLLLSVALIPGIPFNFNGKEMSFTEIWSSGIGIFTIYVSLAMPFCARLLLKRKAYSRLIYLFVLSSVMVAPYVYWMEKVGMIFGVITTVLIAVYMYGTPSVRRYFTSNKALQPTAESGG